MASKNIPGAFFHCDMIGISTEQHPVFVGLQNARPVEKNVYNDRETVFPIGMNAFDPLPADQYQALPVNYRTGYARPDRRISMKNGCVPVGNTDMYYVSFGRGKGKLVVLPGLSDGLATVRGKALFLSLPYRKFLRDHTVYMFSRKNDMPEGYAMEDMADDQVLAMRSLGIDRACLMGVSQGGMIAQCIAARHPKTVTKLILAVTAPNANDTVRAAVKGWMDMAKNGDHNALMADTAEKMYSDKYLKNRKYLSMIAGFTKPSGYDRFMKNACAILDFDGRDNLSKITCPTLIIAGSNDRAVGNSAAHELNRGITESELYVYEGLGHGAFEEAKDFYDRVLSFCDTGT